MDSEIRDRKTEISMDAIEPKLAKQKPGTINQMPGDENLETKK
jgi:hypothetical protein